MVGAIVAAAASIAVVAAVSASERLPREQRSPTVSLPPEAWATPGSPTPTPAPTVEPTPDPPPRVAFLGDSYTQGGGAETNDDRWSTLVSRDLGWVEKNLGLGGTGFVTTNSFLGCGREYCPTYVEMVAEAVELGPDIVVVAGGQNDLPAFSRDPDAVRAAVHETYGSLRGHLPEADIVAVGPSTPWDIDDLVRALDDAVREAAETVGAQYISMLDPNVIDPAHALGDGHVGNDGHRAIADRVVDAFIAN